MARHQRNWTAPQQTSPTKISVKQLYLVERDVDAANIHFQVVWLQTKLFQKQVFQIFKYIHIFGYYFIKNRCMLEIVRYRQLVMYLSCDNFRTYTFFLYAGKLTHHACSCHQYAIWQVVRAKTLRMLQQLSLTLTLLKMAIWQAVFINASFQRQKPSELFTILLVLMIIMSALPLFMPEQMW